MRMRPFGLAATALPLGLSLVFNLAAPGTGWTATKLAAADIQSTFFDGKPFTAATPSNIKFKMTFMPDGKVTREPVGKSGVKGEGTWKLSKDGFCTTWKNSKASCFTLAANGTNKWSVLRGPAVVATWSK